MNLSRTEIKNLIETREGFHVSVYLPTHQKGPETQQNPIRLKNLLRDAERQLLDLGASPPDTDRLLADARRLLDDAAFWKHRTKGLCLFLATNFFRHYDLPFPSAELALVTHRFHLKPIVRLLYRDARFYLLALSQNEARAFACDREGVALMEVPGMPRSLEEATIHDDAEKQIQFHTGTPTSGAGNRSAIYHGHGAGADDAATRLLRYFQGIDRALRSVLADEDAPLVVAGVDYLHAIYRQANSYKGLMENGITGSPQNESETDLHHQAWRIVRPIFEASRKKALADYLALSGSRDPRSASDLEQILPAACHGRVAYLFVALGVQRWGSYDAPTGRLEDREERQPGDEDLLDLAAVHTLANGGDVYAMPPEDMPVDATVAAVFRY
jgi:hypothetical protein